MEGNAPVYVRIQEYEDVITTLETVKRKLKEAQDLLAKLQELKSQEDKEIMTWTESLGDVQERLQSLESNLKQ